MKEMTPQNDFLTKGTIMSGGSRCVIAEMLSILGFRESGILDWGNNTVGIKAFIQAISGSTQYNICKGTYEYRTDLIDDKVQVYPFLDGVEYYHETKSFRGLDIARLNQPTRFMFHPLYTRAMKTKYWFNIGKPFVYLLGKEESQTGYWWDVLDTLPLDNLLVITDKDFHNWYGLDSEGQGKLLIRFYGILNNHFPKEVLTKRRDYNIDKYRGRYDNALKTIGLL